MSLLQEAWMPVLDRSGARRWISPVELCDSELLSFDANRADFNGTLAQFATGLLSTFAPLTNERDWERWFTKPPKPEELQAWWAGHENRFGYEGDAERFMQDATLSAPPETSISGLLIDSPGENTLKNNSDHFVKRGRIEKLCPHCAVTALLTLQVNAPAGGAGHRTGLRGGGPLTTLLVCQPSKSLWHDLWLNVIEPPERDAYGGDAGKTAPHFTFPWLAPIETLQQDRGETPPIQTHPMHIHWAMPRRIRLDFSQVSEGTCDICRQESLRLVSRYATVPNGLNYKGPWDHVLSPYYRHKEEWLPLHPQPGGFGYRHWLPWLVGVADEKSAQRPARVVTHFRNRHRARTAGTTSLWAFGYDMDNMKPRCWYEARLPVHNLEGCSASDHKLLQEVLHSWLTGAKDCAYALRSAVKLAWLGPEGKGDFSAVDTAFWSRTEPTFYALLQQLIDTLCAGASDEQLEALTRVWLRTLQSSCNRLFEEVFVGTGQVELKKPSRVALARKQLSKSLGGPRLKDTLLLPNDDPAPVHKQPAQTTA